MPILTKDTFIPVSLNNQLPAYLSYFISGMAILEYWELILKKLNFFIIPSLIIFVICTIANIPVLSCFVKPITLSIIVTWVGLSLKLFYNIGKQKDYSYSMYLVHYPLIMSFVASSFFEKNWYLAFLGILGTTFLVSFLLEKIMEVLSVNCKYRIIQNTNTTN